MARKTIAQHRDEILTSIAGGYPAFGTVNCVQGQRWLTAAERLRDEGLVRIVSTREIDDRGWGNMACIPADAEWDCPTQSFRRVPPPAN